LQEEMTKYINRRERKVQYLREVVCGENPQLAKPVASLDGAIGQLYATFLKLQRLDKPGG
jgi:hypothetical protein